MSLRLTATTTCEGVSSVSATREWTMYEHDNQIMPWWHNQCREKKVWRCNARNKGLFRLGFEL